MNNNKILINRALFTIVEAALLFVGCLSIWFYIMGSYNEFGGMYPIWMWVGGFWFLIAFSLLFTGLPYLANPSESSSKLLSLSLKLALIIFGFPTLVISGWLVANGSVIFLLHPFLLAAFVILTLMLILIFNIRKK